MVDFAASLFFRGKSVRRLGWRRRIAWAFDRAKNAEFGSIISIMRITHVGFIVFIGVSPGCGPWMNAPFPSRRRPGGGDCIERVD
jgi:hypothetical protein